MFKSLTLAASAALLFTSSAMAADAVVYNEPAPVVVDTFSWTGGYIGAHAGYGWGNTHDVNNPNADKKKLKGGFGGLQAGYNWQFDNNVVLGAEADVSFGSIKKNWMDDSQYGAYYTQDKIGTHGTVRARLGYAVDRFLPYVTGGLAWADTKHTLGCENALKPAGNSCKKGAADFETSQSKTRIGYAVGAGLEYALTDNWTVKGEYLYTNLGKKTVTLVDPSYPALSDRRFKTDTSEVRIGVNYKF